MASKLRYLFLFWWSNSVPHCDVLSPSYAQAWEIILYLVRKDKQFACITTVKDTVNLLKIDFVPKVLVRDPSKKWDFIWKNVNHSVFVIV